MENKIKLPVYETLGLIMAFHTLKSKENSNIIFNEDLVFFQCLLNKNLSLKFNKQMQNTTFLVETTFENSKEKEENKKRLPYGELIKASLLLKNKNNGLLPLDYVRKFYDYNAKAKLSKAQNGQLTEDILGQVSAKIALYDYLNPEDYEKARYMYWCGDASRQVGEAGYSDTFINHTAEAYKIGANSVCAKIAGSLGQDINNVYNVIKATLEEFEHFGYLSSNTGFIKYMMECEKIRQNGQNVGLSEQERKRYNLEFQRRVNFIDNYLKKYEEEHSK